MLIWLVMISFANAQRKLAGWPADGLNSRFFESFSRSAGVYGPRRWSVTQEVQVLGLIAKGRVRFPLAVKIWQYQRFNAVIARRVCSRVSGVAIGTMTRPTCVFLTVTTLATRTLLVTTITGSGPPEPLGCTGHKKRKQYA